MKEIKEIFAGAEELIEKALELETGFDVSTGREIHTKNNKYWFEVKLRKLNEKENK